jgi:hypothetical protein
MGAARNCGIQIKVTVSRASIGIAKSLGDNGGRDARAIPGYFSNTQTKDDGGAFVQKYGRTHRTNTYQQAQTFDNSGQCVYCLAQ